MKRRSFLQMMAGAGLTLPAGLRGSVLLPQTALPGSNIPQFVDPLPVFGPAGPIPRVTGSAVRVGMQEVEQQVLSTGAGLGKTWVWGYNVGNTMPLYPGITIEARQGIPTDVTYVNQLPTGLGNVRPYVTLDQSIHWANPLGVPMDDPSRMSPYQGPPPTVVHLHGAEVQSRYDGGPDQWFTPDGIHGSSYNTYANAGANAAVYHYPNTQNATTLWFHDHTLGATRLNVYCGLAAFYLLRDQHDTGLPNNPLGLPAGPREVEIVIQDRQFDTNGQWYFPDSDGAGLSGGPPNPSVHPFWIPEFFGDAIVVNGKTWPYLDVTPQRYRFRFLNGSNARFYNLNLGLPFWVIGTDGGLLDAPVRVDRLFLAPGERADVIVDFASARGDTLVMTNDAPAPFPDGDDPLTAGNIMQFRVATGSVVDKTFNPAAGGPPLRRPPMIRLVDPVAGVLGKKVTADVRRQLTLKEIATEDGPVEVLVNNTKWTGMIEGTNTPVDGLTKQDTAGDYLSELPRIGSTEIWEIINLTEDAHPIHLHLVQFQLMNRQEIDRDAYLDTWNAAFPSHAFQPGFGPPRPYNTPNTDGAVGGNPAVSPYLCGPARPPDPEEAGWKDTVKMFPGEVTRIVVRFAPQDVNVNVVKPGQNKYPFDPTVGPGYVWHCHIIDHEDNEMMRPYIPVP